MKAHFLTFSLLVLFHCTTTLAQSLDVTKILEKAGHFSTLIRLLKTTHVGDRMKTQLDKEGLTILAPTDNAFSSLKGGTLNSLTDAQQVQLILFHTIPSFLTTSQFQTVPNPLGTQAGDSSSGQFRLNVTTSGNQVNVSTGIVDATVGKAIYSDNQLAVYQVDKVLLPRAIFGSTPGLFEKPKNKSVPAADSLSSNSDSSPDAYGAIRLGMHGLLVGLVAVVIGFYM